MWGVGRTVVAALVVLVAGACSGDDGSTSTVTRADGYAVVAAGEVDKFSWRVLRLSRPDDTPCWKVETHPDLGLNTPFKEWCLHPDPALPREFAVEFPWASGVDGDFDIVVGVVPEEIGAAEFAFTDGSTAEPTFLDREQGIIVWAGRSRPVAASVTITMAADGFEVACGPGEITSAGQLAGADEARLIEARTYPWACLEAF